SDSARAMRESKSAIRAVYAACGLPTPCRLTSSQHQAQGGVEVFGRHAFEPRARIALQATDAERGQHRRLRIRVDGGRDRAVGLGGDAQALPQLRLDPIEELVHAHEQAIV